MAAAQSPSPEQRIRIDTIGRFLKEARQNCGLTQADVAEVLGYESPQFVSNWERGVASPPFDALPTLTRILAIPPKEMLAVVADLHRRLGELRQEELRKLLIGERRLRRRS